MIQKSKIAIFDFPGHPFQYQLASYLSLNYENKIFHIHNPKQLGPKSFFESNRNLEIIKVSKNFSKNFYKRFLDEIVYSFQICYTILKIKPNVIISSNSPLIPQLFLFILCKMLGIKFIFWLQDIISIAAKEILSKNRNFFKNLVFNFFSKIEFFILKNSYHVVTISEDFDKILISNNVKNEKITCIPNWSPLEDIPMLDKSNSFSIKNNLQDSFNILYSGTLGFKHNPDIILNLSKFLIDNKKDAKIIIVSEGHVVDYIKSESKKNKLNNIIFLPFQDFNIFPEVLASADVSLVMLEKSAGQFSVPSKLLSILCSGRIPILHVSKNNLSSRIVINNNCGFSLDNQSELNNRILDIYQNKDQYSQIALNARKYAEENFDIKIISKKFLDIIF
tara:strand:+ start:247 stop:1422 length:1176 start_codon:yes stop_codon:yes gene_type:complete